MLGRWPVGSYEEQEESRGGRCTEATLGLLQICENGCEVEDQKREEGIEKLNSEERAGWHELQAVKSSIYLRCITFTKAFQLLCWLVTMTEDLTPM